MTYASIFGIFSMLGSGMIFDILGRRWTVSIMFLLAAASTVPFPYGASITNTANQIIMYDILKIIVNVTSLALIMSPFINDYVVVQDRGRAMGLMNTGLVIGALSSVGILYTLTSKLSYNISFTLLAIL
jgi:MFS family permease